MTETKKLYYENVSLREFSARVLECRETKKGWAVLLDQTAFYPEGGGQPYDTGTLGEARVLEVHERDGELLHYTDRMLEPGSNVLGKIDWERRFDLMQQHSGEHIVSGRIHARFGYDNVGFHMGADVITIDFNGEITPQQMAEIEREVNQYLWENAEVSITYPTAEELEKLDYRSKKELKGWVRIVEFPGADCCACCGLHVRRAGEIGAVKLLSVEKFRSGVRMEMLCGKRVLSYLNTIQEQNRQVSVLLSAKPEKTAEAVERLSAENFRLKGRLMALEEESFRQKAAHLAGSGDVLLFEAELGADSVRKLAAAVMETCGARCAVFSDQGDGGFKYALGETDGDLRTFVREMNAALGGRGGGKPFFVQGQVQNDRKNIQKYFEKADFQIVG